VFARRKERKKETEGGGGRRKEYGEFAEILPTTSFMRVIVMSNRYQATCKRYDGRREKKRREENRASKGGERDFFRSSDGRVDGRAPRAERPKRGGKRGKGEKEEEKEERKGWEEFGSNIFSLNLDHQHYHQTREEIKKGEERKERGGRER